MAMTLRQRACGASTCGPQARRSVVRPCDRRMPVVVASAKTSASITVQRSPSPETLQKLGVKQWPTWGCGVSKFPWSYGSTETAYVLEGEVTVTPDGGDPVDIQAGDLCTFPAGMSCTWDVKKPINKHYNFS